MQHCFLQTNPEHIQLDTCLRWCQKTLISESFMRDGFCTCVCSVYYVCIAERRPLSSQVAIAEYIKWPLFPILSSRLLEERQH